MVPGSTLRYGSNFCSVTRSPRLSSRHPMDAAAMPLPRDETTPPVTKMYLAIGISLVSLRQRRFKQRRHSFEVLRSIHAQRLVFGFHYAHAISVFKRPQLLQPLRPLQGTDRQAGIGEQEFAVVHVKANMFVMNGAALDRK